MKRKSLALFLALLLAVAPILSSDLFGTAQALTYRTGANGPAATYKASKYYTHATSIDLTGDAVTDILSLALSQLGYYEGTSSNPYGGLYNTNTDYTSNKTTEYVYNYGDADSSGYKMAWCASFCSWAIFQAGVTNHSTHADSCRNHIGDRNYIWRECSCYQWADQLKRFDMYYARGSHTPKAGDLIFFKMDGGGTAWTNHIGLVLYSDGSRVYTVEGNRKNHVGLYNYSLSDSQICGYGVLPYPKKDDVVKVDYTGKNKTEGKYITNNATLAVSASKGGSTSFSVGKYEMFEVTGFDGGYAKVTYGGKTGYATLSSTTIQVTASAEPVKSMDASVVTTDGKTRGYAGGSKLPDSNNNFQNVNVLVEGLRENTNNYKGLENYGTNKDKIIINGRTLSKWESRSGSPIINNIWVYSAGDGKAYLGIDIADTSKLRMKGRDGTGEEIESIVIKRGFEIVGTNADYWTAGEISTTSSAVESVVGVFKENVVLTPADNTYFNVTLGGSNSLGLDGLTFQTANAQVAKITAGTNIRLEPNTEAYALGFGNPGETYEYLGEVRNSKWLMVDYKGHVCWISSDGASVVDAPQYVTLTADANIRSGADTTYSVLGVGLAGESFEYLGEIANTKWLKVSYNGQVGWVSNVNATLGAQKTVVNVTAENKDWIVPIVVNVSTVNGAQIRTTGVQGLRFISSIEKNDDFSHVVEYGTVLIPSADITDISQLTIGATLNGHTVAKVPANVIYNETDTEVTFTAVITNISDKNLSREYTARAYAILDDGSVVYADTGASRSVYGVAKAGLEAGRESEAVLDIFRDIIETVERYGDNDFSWPW